MPARPSDPALYCSPRLLVPPTKSLQPLSNRGQHGGLRPLVPSTKSLHGGPRPLVPPTTSRNRTARSYHPAFRPATHQVPLLRLEPDRSCCHDDCPILPAAEWLSCLAAQSTWSSTTSFAAYGRMDSASTGCSGTLVVFMMGRGRSATRTKIPSSPATAKFGTRCGHSLRHRGTHQRCISDNKQTRWWIWRHGETSGECGDSLPAPRGTFRRLARPVGMRGYARTAYSCRVRARRGPLRQSLAGECLIQPFGYRDDWHVRTTDFSSEQ